VTGGNVTGTTVGPVTDGNYLELLKEAVPKLTRVAILLDSTFPGLTAMNGLPSRAEAAGLVILHDRRIVHLGRGYCARGAAMSLARPRCERWN